MLKKSSFNLLFMVLPLFAMAQTDKQYEIVAEGTCNCINKKNLKSLNKESVSAELGICMLGALEVLPADARKKFDFMNPEKARALGEKIGFQMAFKCPKIIAALGATMSEEKDGTQTPTAPEAITVEGKVKQVIEGDYVTVVLVDAEGREHKLIWADHFTGEAPFIANPQDLKDKKVAIGYQLLEKYVPKMHDYYALKQIVRLEVQ
jgi:hypothetical protein